MLTYKQQEKRSSHHVILLVLFILMSGFYSSIIAQNAVNATLPFGISHIVYSEIPSLELPSIDTVYYQNKNNHVLNLAYNFKTDFSPASHLQGWHSYSAHYKTWHLKIQSKGAGAIALVISNIHLKVGERLFIYNSKGMLGSFDHNTIPPKGILPLDYLGGDEIVVEFDSPSQLKENGSFRIATVSHAYTNLTNAILHNASNSQVPVNSRTQEDCYLCIEGERLEQTKRSVVRIIVHGENSTKVCTGTLMNNTAKDKRPFILTAQHCISSQEDAERSVFTFNYELLNCNNDVPVENFTLSGSTYLASLYENDFSLLELNDFPPLNFHPYYAGWDVSDEHRTFVTSIHHARGGPKTISIYQGTVKANNFEDKTIRAPNAFWKIFAWDAGATEGGSSGAPLFNSNQLVIGSLTGGSSSCGSPFNDYFQRLSQSWEPSTDYTQQLKHWLDPLSSGTKTLAGLDPFEGITTSCDTLSNLQPGEEPTLISYKQGYYSGYNTDHIVSFAEKFNTLDSIMLTGSTFDIGSINKNSPGGILVAVHENSSGVPGAAVYETFVPYSRFGDSGNGYVSFYPYRHIKGTFFISFSMSYSLEDTFAIRQSPWRNNVENTAFVKLPTGWKSMQSISPEAKGASLNIQAFSCKLQTKTAPNEEADLFTMYPNPASSMLIINFKESEINAKPGVIDLHGKMHPVAYNFFDNNLMISTGDLSPGIYIVRFSLHGKPIQARFIKL